MKGLLLSAAVILPALFTTNASAESFNDLCLRISAEWGTTGDVTSQCSCLAGLASGDAALEEELTMLANTKSSDEEAYDAGSDAAKAALDSCSVDS